MWLKWTESHQQSVPSLDRVNVGLMYVFNPLMEPCLIPLNPFCTWWMLFSWEEWKPWLIVNSIVNAETGWIYVFVIEWSWPFSVSASAPPAPSLRWIFSYGWKTATFLPEPCLTSDLCFQEEVCVVACWHHSITRELSDVNPILLTVLPKQGWCITQQALPVASHPSSWSSQHRGGAFNFKQRRLILLNGFHVQCTHYYRLFCVNAVEI